MKKLKNVLGLELHNDFIMDKFMRMLVSQLDMIISKCNEDGLLIKKEAIHLEKRMEMAEKAEYAAYEEALYLLASLDSEYKKYLSNSSEKHKKGQEDCPPLVNFIESLKKKIRLAYWVGMGNEIPWRELNEVTVGKLLKQKGYVFRRKKGELGWWYQDELFVGKAWFVALKHLETFEKIDRRKLT
ncbi:MAG: hypothetical protein WAV31_03500 [Candidatus Moraniibacteriota bacterium]